MEIIHKVMGKRKDGSLTELVPFKDIVVEAPGYTNWGGDWRRARDKEAQQENQMYEERDRLLPKEADTWECVDFHSSEDGGRAVYRAYIDAAKIPQLKQQLRDCMIYGNIVDIITSRRKFKFSDQLSEQDRKWLESQGYLIKVQSKENNQKRAFFYIPKKLSNCSINDVLRAGYWQSDNGQSETLIHTCNSTDLNHFLWDLKDSKDGLVDKLRAELFKEIIKRERS